MMAAGAVSHVVVGADRIAANGDVVNKIGTYALAVLAREHGVPSWRPRPPDGGPPDALGRGRAGGGALGRRGARAVPVRAPGRAGRRRRGQPGLRPHARATSCRRS